MSFPAFDDNKRAALRQLASETLSALQSGSYSIPGGRKHNLTRKIEASNANTRYYSPDSTTLSSWSSGTGFFSSYFAPRTPTGTATTETTILQISTLDKIGILNFASATKPGGGFINGAQAQEESIARASTLYPTLLTHTAQQFYQVHSRDARQGFYTHAIIYSPGIVVFRDDSGAWTEPFDADVLTCAAVNAGEVRQSSAGRHASVEDKIEREMKERMGRVLYLFEKEGVKDIVLGSFGTGVFRNNVSFIAKTWADLLSAPGARFGSSFERVMFAITGERTFAEFEAAYKARSQGGRGAGSPSASF